MYDKSLGEDCGAEFPPSSHQVFVVFAYLLCLMHLVVLFAELISCVFCRVGKCAGEGYEA